MYDDKMILTEFDDEFLEKFRKGVWMAVDEEELLSVIPDSRYPGYIDILTYFRNYVVSEVSDTVEMLNSDISDEEKKYLKEDLVISNMRLDVFNSLIIKYNEKLKKEAEINKNIDNFKDSRRIIYLKSKAGNVLVESDLDGITDKGAVDMKDVFDYLRTGIFTSNQTKYRALTNSNALKGVREVKNFQSRIYFCHLEYDIVIVILALIKKDNNPKKENLLISHRNDMFHDVIKKIESALADPIKREELLAEGSEITERIDNLLNCKIRGVKK